ncbi:MAG: sigma-70 family RNA polymerase sigma factor, partial [Verrucomicrobiota bacterium]
FVQSRRGLPYYWRMGIDDSTGGSDRTEAYLKLLAEHERALGIYVTGLVGSPQDAQDILQEGKIVMWRNFDSFEIGTNFLAWGRKILFHQILSWRRKSKRHSGAQLSEETLGILDSTAEIAAKERKWIDREAALSDCMKQLKTAHRELLDMRYRDENSIERIAHQTGKTEGAVYRLLSRLRRSLYECVESNIGGSASA